MAGSFSVAIAARDQASGTLDRINARLASVNKQVALARAPFDRLSQSASKFARLTGIGRIASSIGAVGRAGLQAFQSVTRIVEPLAAIGGAASIAGMVRLATAWAEFGSQLGNAAARAGLTSDKLLALENAGRLAGVSAEATAGAMTTLRDNMVNAVAGTAPQVIGTLQALGLSLDDARRYAADTTKALPELADKIAAIKDPTVQALVATRLFGSAGEAMLPWLRKGSAGIADYTARAERYGTINAAGVAAANQLREAQVGLTLAVTGLGYAVAEQLAPSLGPLLNQMANWIAANRDWIAQGIGDKVRQFAGYLQQVDWAQVGADVMAVVHGVERFVDALGGVVPAAELVVGFFAVAWAAKMMAPILMVANALRRLPTQAAVAARESNAELGKIKPGAIDFGKALFGGLLAHEALNAADPQDAFGAWIDRNVPGAAAVDNLASKLGLGRSYGQQQAVDNSLGYGDFPGDARHYAAPPAFRLPPNASNADRGHDPNAQRRDTSLPSGPNARGGSNLLPYDAPTGPYDGGGGPERNLRNNNPTNLNFAGQKGASSDGRFARFPTMEAGVAADLRQFLLYQEKHQVKSIEGMIHRATPESDNNPGVEDYIDRVAAAMHMKRSDIPNLRDPAVAARFITAVAPNEGGTPDAGAVDRGVHLMLAGPGPSGPTPTLPPNPGTAASPGGAPTPIASGGQVGVGVSLINAPPGMQTTVVQSGQGLAPATIDRGASGFGSRRDQG